jgi:hypothetical protein
VTDEIPIEWLRQFVEIDHFWRDGEFDYAREALRRLAYDIRSVDTPPIVQEKLKALIQNFTRADPMYADVMLVALPVISANPGLVQSVLSKQFPQFDADQFRYAMYYGEVIGDVIRNKKGSSYTLYLPKEAPVSNEWKQPNHLPLIKARQHQALRRKQELEKLKEFRPFWQLVGECAEGERQAHLADDLYWQTACVPWNCTKLICRCQVYSMTRSEMEQRAINSRAGSTDANKSAPKMVSTIEVNAEQAAEWLYELFQQNMWLLTAKPARHIDPNIEYQAINFILAVAKQGLRDWGDTSQAVKETVSLLMMDFIAKLMHPQSPFAKMHWEVAISASNTQKVLEIVACEIYQGHPWFLAPN